MSDENTIDYYLNNKNILQDKINQLEQSQLIELFNIILSDNPEIQYSKNKNGYFVDIKILPTEIIEKLNIKADELININSSSYIEEPDTP